jgi:hypothetical protein
MKITHVLGTTLAVGIAGALQASATPVSISVPPFAFLRYHVDSTQQFAREVSIDTTVQDRFARHFHMAGPAVASFIENDLVLKPLSAAHEFHVYCVTSKGHEYSFVENLPAGTPVFVRKQDGLPVINQVDGNPLVNNLPPVLQSNDHGPTALARFSQPDVNLNQLRTVQLGTTPTGFDSIDYFSYDGTQVGATENSSGIYFVDQSGDALFSPFTATPLGPPAYAYGEFISAAGIVALFNHSVPGGGATVNPPSVPEPAPVAAIAIGAAGLGILVMRRKLAAKAS